MDNKKNIVGYVDFEMILKDKVKYAWEFSQKNPTLCNLLLRLWANNVETLACSNKDDEDTPNIIAFYMPFHQKELISKVLEAIYNLDYAIITIGKGFNRDNLYVDIRSYLNGDNMFRTLFEALPNYDTKMEVKSNENIYWSKVETLINDEDKAEIVEMVEFIENFNYDSYLVKLEKNNSFKNDNFELSIAKKDDSLIRPNYFICERYSRFSLKEAKEIKLSR